MQVHLLRALHGRRHISASIIATSRHVYRQRLSSLSNNAASLRRNAGGVTAITLSPWAGEASSSSIHSSVQQQQQQNQRRRYTSWENNRAFSSMATAQQHPDDDDEMDEDVMRFAKSNLASLLEDDSTLVEDRSWIDDQWDISEVSSDTWDENEDEEGEADYASADLDEDDESFATKTPQHLVAEEEQKALPRRRKEGERVVSRNMADLLSSFDPQNPPPPDASPLDIQLWLECESQHESVLRYEKVIEDARARRDYSSLTAMQRQLLNWYGPLRDAIEEEQKEYMLGPDVVKKSAEHETNEATTATQQEETKPTTPPITTKIKKKTRNGGYGPFLCTLQAEKLAVITAHEATMYALNSGDNSRLTMMAKRIGDAVEAEVHVQRALRQKLEERKSYNRMRKMEGMNDVEEGSDNSINSENVENDLQKFANQKTEESIEKSDDTLEEVDQWMYGGSHLERFVEEANRFDPGRKARLRIATANRRALALLNSDEEWTEAEKIKLGVALIKILLENATIKFNDDSHNQNSAEPAFTYEQRWLAKNRRVGHVLIHPKFFKMMVEDKFESFAGFTTRHQPMVLPPRDWVGPDDGGYSAVKIELMRTHGCQVQKDAIQQADLSTVFDGLNVLGRVPWVINKTILSVAQRCWDEGVVLGDIPSREDFDLPPMPVKPEKPFDWADTAEYKASDSYKAAVAEFRTYREGVMKHRRIHQKNMDLNSLRCSAMLKLDQAEKFKEFKEIFFPYNMDFRGRAYPVPPHLSNVGSDLCRGMLKFSTSKPLGPRGLYWLKVHLANLAGADKMSFDDRAAFTEKNMSSVRAAVADPFGEDRWWMKLDDPFQGLATCHEIVNAIDSGDPESYECSLPVHMDGSCNGLQHYAALGRDRVGGRAVNLCNDKEPQDVYIGVMEEVIRRVAEEASKELDLDESKSEEWTKAERTAWKNNKAARLVNGHIDRGVVKRTVMTSVYGVTYIGARTQIQEKIEEKLEAQGQDIDDIESEIHSACGYLATVTMDVMGTLFTGARQTMDWLASCARLISQQGQPVAWLSPIGVPAVQPYRQNKPYTIYTLVQKVVLTNSSDNLPIHKSRQVSAFPPNYVHSLDSSHMLLTALEMDRRGLTFSAVHDSFWTHACDIDEMNGCLRDCFVDLYDQPLLEELKRTWELRYPSLNFPDIPERGDLDLNEVKSAKYFFQ